MLYLAHLRSDFDRRFRDWDAIVSGERGSEHLAGGRLADHYSQFGPRSHGVISVPRVRTA